MKKNHTEKKTTCKDKARIVITSSVAHKFGSIRWHDLNSTQSYNSGSAYAQSKLANVLYANALARKLQVNYIMLYYSKASLLSYP